MASLVGVGAVAGSRLLAALPGVGTVVGIAQGALSIGGALARMRAAEAGAAAQIKTGAGALTSDLRQALLEAIAQRDLAAAAPGVDLSFGTPAFFREQAANSEHAADFDAKHGPGAAADMEARNGSS